MMNLIISPVGTSLLTNNARDHYKLLNQTANCKENELDKEQKAEIDEIAKDSEKALNGTQDYAVYKELSAELNGIFSYKDPSKQDHHILIATDTYQCKLVAEIIKAKLRKHCGNVETPEFKGLSTTNKEAFEGGIDAVIKYMADTLPGYRERRYNIVFNLTGGFKSVIGYLNLLAMFYADEVLYIFERNEELIRIPRLPIKIDEDKIGESAPLMAMLAVTPGGCMQVSKLNNNRVETDNLYEALFEKINDKNEAYIGLSTYGKLVWDKWKEDKCKSLMDFPYLTYTKKFKESFEKGKSMQHFQEFTNTSLALLASIFVEHNFDMTLLGGDPSLEYEKLAKGIGHFRISDKPTSYRGFCVPKDGKLLMVDCGNHELVEVYQNRKPEDIKSTS